MKASSIEVGSGLVPVTITNRAGEKITKSIDLFTALDVMSPLITEEEATDTQRFERCAEALKKMGGWEEVGCTQAFLIYKSLVKAKEDILKDLDFLEEPGSPTSSS